METMCGEFKVPEAHLTDCHTCDSKGRNCGKKASGGSGVDGVDFVLYVSSITTQQCLEAVGGKAETVAYAAHCQQEESLDRPVAGHTNICPSAIRDSVTFQPVLARPSVRNITGERQQQSSVDTEARAPPCLRLLLQSVRILQR